MKATQFIALALLPLLMTSCGTRKVPADINGYWISEAHPITVRTREDGEWIFTSDTVKTTLVIVDKNCITGYIGSAKIVGGKAYPNWMLPTKMTGVSVIIRFDLDGKIFPNDPLEHKQVELWIGHLDNLMQDVELRYTSKSSKFPMAGINFHEVE
jgi:hypothetical protein